MKGNVLLVTSDKNFANGCNEYFLANSNYLITTASDDIDIIAKLNSYPEFLILDSNNFVQIENIMHYVKENAVILMLTEKHDKSFRVFNKVDYYINKPCSAENLAKIVSNISQKVFPLRRYSVLERRIASIFILLGIPINTIGYRMLKIAVELAVSSPLIATSITKNLYPVVANQFDTTASKVERDIRHSIEIAYNKGTIFNIEQLFGVSVFSKKEKPTNSEFISTVAEKLRLEGFGL